MKNLRILIAVSIALSLYSCGPKIYKSAALDQSKSKVKTLAVLPFEVSIDSKKLQKGASAKVQAQSEEKTGYDIQNSAYSWFLQREKKYSVTFQDVSRTNALLSKANISYGDLALQDRADLCRILGVDAVVTGKAALSRPMSAGASIALGVLTGTAGNTNQTTTSLAIHDTDGKLLWKYDYEASGSIGSSSDGLANALMRNASKKFPYKN